MGTEISQPDVEEPTEPPICPSIHEESNKHQPSSTLDPQVQVDHCPANYQDWHAYYQHAHTISIADTARILRVDLQHGLSSTEASSRFERDGPNKIKSAEGISMWKILLRQVSNSLTLVLLITMALSFGINDYIEGGVITAVILLNIVVGFVQDYRAEKTILSLQALSVPTCKVVRDGRIDSIKAETLVVGDIVQLAVGDMVPADLRLFDGINASTDEALLTGESMPISKHPDALFTSRDMAVGDRTNMAYSGSIMTRGRATGIVISIGMDTEVGKIAQLLRDNTLQAENASIYTRVWKRFKRSFDQVLGLVGTPLQVKLSKFALLLFALAIILAIIVFSANKWHIQGEVLIYGICVAVAVIPESLIAVLTITVAVGTKSMAKGNVIVRKLQALEAVGGVTNICSDKTGTLTQGKMIARKAWIPGTGTLAVHDTNSPFDPNSGLVQIGGKDIQPNNLENSAGLTTFLHTISLCNLSSVYNPDTKLSTEGSHDSKEGDWVAVGEPTEIALHVLAIRFNSGKRSVIENNGLELVSEFPFDSAIKRMTVVYKRAGSEHVAAYSKGATESMLPLLSIDDDMKQEIRAKVDRMAGEGLRVLCIAHKTLSPETLNNLPDRTELEQDLDFVGLVGLYDAPRMETAGAVRKCHMAGITVHMLTGDHIKTATAIAYEVGILGNLTPNVRASKVVMGADEFDKMTDDEIDAVEALPLVIARCSPSTKVRMVEAMHRRGAYCVMTGDGVNDSPALKRADVGIAMGKNGSDVAKAAADMVLTDDDFASVVKAVEEGRRLFDNIQKFLMHLLISNIAQVILLLIALAFKDDEGDSVFPLSPLEILWANLITSSFLALGLGLEEGQADIMYRPPHNLRVGVFTKELIVDKMIYGTFMGSLCLVSFVSVVYGVGGGSLGQDCNEDWNPTCDIVFRARATTFATLSFLLLVTAWEVKHFSRSLFNLDPARYPGVFSVFPTLWRNRFLFWAVAAGFVTSFPVIYIPVVNKLVFKHVAISWEWGIVAGCVVVYIALIESWKAVKRALKIGSAGTSLITMQDAEMRAGLFMSDSLLADSAITSREETLEKKE
ncbi:potassium/sodium efflux P-type ATPase, fungal-type [Trichophyton violaceum]|uniref:Sodium/potassium exporting P-type ATPase 1 n=1 Tax=Trichophyton violaceum TaxID=34388 RepID=A0A178FSQ7_TRIVO|nr:potassium/sodium efflux P-type ATPase, fungal-type [Trichophyton violaceum]